MRADVFYRKFRKDRAQAPVLTASIEVDPGMTIEELLEECAAAGIAGGGNTWAGVFEIQTDEGIWSCREGGVLRRGTPTFRTWDQVEADEAVAS